jgi:hypothetical protein
LGQKTQLGGLQLALLTLSGAEAECGWDGTVTLLRAPIDAFHETMREKASAAPSSMSVSSFSYATKFREDARMRVLAISEASDTWANAVKRWRERRVDNLTTFEDAVAPDPKTEWLIYQTLAAWPGRRCATWIPDPPVARSRRVRPRQIPAIVGCLLMGSPNRFISLRLKRRMSASVPQEPFPIPTVNFQNEQFGSANAGFDLDRGKERPMAQSSLAHHERAADKTAKRHRKIQSEIDRIDQDKGTSSKRAPQTGARVYPVPPFPKQHLKKPGIEAKLEPAPLYDAPYYLGSKKLDGKAALITGSDSGIGRAVAVLFAREGADVAIVHLDEEADADTTRKLVEDEGKRCLVIAGDVRKRSFCEAAVKRTVKELGKIDVLVNNAAFQLHTDDLDDLTEQHFDETIKTNLYGYFFLARLRQ